MGSGIAAHLCNANIPVVLLDLKTEIAEKAKNIDEDFDLAYPKSAIAANLGGGLLTGYLAGSTKTAQKLYKWIQGLPKLWKGVEKDVKGV